MRGAQTTRARARVRLYMCVCALYKQELCTGAPVSYARMRVRACASVSRVTHADPAADQDYLFNRDYCVGRRG